MEKYEKLEKIGEGSYGEVWKVKLRKDPPSVKSKFVLKLISLEKANKKEREFADQEANLLKSLKHPNIVSCKDTFLLGDDRHPALGIVMSFCEGGDLHHKLRTTKGVGKLSEKEVMQWFIQITLAVQFLHSKKILHRDLKTQNVFLTRSNLVKVGDLGIAKVLEDGQMALTLIGTPYYMSPEVFQNIPYNFKSDIWSLGCILYEMTSLKHAFTAQDFRSLVNKVVSGQMPNMPSGYSAGVTDLISQMLQYKPDQRPSAQDILKKSFIQKNIESFLTNTSNSKQKKNSSKSKPGTPFSAAASRKKNNSGSKDEIDSATPHTVEEEKQFFADNDLPTIKQQHVSPQIKQSRSPSFPYDAQSSNGSRDSTEDVTLTPKKKLSSSSLKGAPKQLLPDMKEVGKNGEPSRNASSIKIQSSRKLSTPDSKLSMGGSAPSTMLKEMVVKPPDKKQPPLSPLARPSSSKKTPSTNYQPPKSAAPPTTRQKSDPGRDQEVRRSKPREERLKKKEQEFAEKDSKKRRPQSALVTSSDGHSESNGGSPYLSDDSDTGSVHKSVEKSETKEEPRRSSVSSRISEGERENNHLNMSGGSASTSDTCENMNEEMDDLMTLLTATLHMDQDNGREEEMLPRDFANSHISANTIAPALQTITLSAKPKDRMKVLQRELEAVFSDDVIAHCLEVMMNSKDEETEDVLKGILGQDKFELYIGKLWHLMLLKKSNKN